MTPKYADSLAKKIINQIQSKIAALEKKKTVPQGFNKNDLKIAKKTLDDIKSIVTFADDTLAEFDERKKPSLNWIIIKSMPYIPCLKRLSKIAITDPNTFELIEMALTLLEELPLNLQDLGEFFNPEAIAVDAKSLGFQLEHIPDRGEDFQEQITRFGLDQDKARAFTYRLTHANEVSPFNAAVIYYTLLLPKISLILHSSIQRYFKHYLYTPHVQQQLDKIKQEPSRIKDIQSILNHQKDWLTTKASQIPALSFDTTANSIDDLEKDIQKSKALLEDYNAHKRELIDKQNAYRTKPMQELAEDPANSENRPWRNKPLPSYSLGLNDDNSVKVIEVSADLNTNCQDIINDIDSKKNALEQHIHFVNTQRIPLIQNRQKLHALMDNKAIDLQTKIYQLKQLSKEFSMITDTEISLENIPPLDDITQFFTVQSKALELQGQADQATKETEEQLLLDRGKWLEDDQKALTAFQESLDIKQDDLDKINAYIAELTDDTLEEDFAKTNADLDALTTKIDLLNKGKIAFRFSKLLDRIYGIVNNNDKKIPEKEINSALRPYFKGTTLSFNLLLNLIDQNAESGKWKEFLSTQNSLLKQKHDPETFASFKTGLLTQIKDKKERFQKDIKPISSYIVSGLSYDDQKRHLEESSRALAIEKETLEEKGLEQANKLSQHKNACAKRDLITSDILAIKYHRDMSEAILSIGKRLLRFENSINSTNALSKSEIDQLTSESDTLAKTIDSYRNSFDANKDNKHYKERLEKYQQILSDTLKKLPKQEKLDVIFKEVMTNSVNKLTAYQQARSKQYRVKDAIFSKDKNERDRFISKLNQQLNAIPVDNKTLMETLNDGLKRFPGHHLSSILNHIIADINEASQDKTIAARLGDKDSLLNTIKTQNEAYAESLSKLYAQIEAMKAYGEQLKVKKSNKDHFNGDTMCGLADALTNQLNYFVKSHQDQLPTHKEAEAFVKHFSARLHSQDDRLNQYSSWGKILGNIALALLLIVRLPWTKLTTGRCSFFFEQTERHKQVNQIEQLAKDAKDAIPVVCEPSLAH